MNAPQPVPQRDEFADLLASAVHDLKNSLGLVLNSAEHIVETEAVSREGHATLQLLQHHARRASTELISLLGMYKLKRGSPLVVPAVVYCADVLEELVAYNMPLLSSRGIEISIDACEAEEGFFDRNLVMNVLNSAINNTFRYARQRVTLGCRVREGYTVFSVTDDGEGYPEALLGSDFDGVGTGDRKQGGTGLGLYFASRVAALHTHRDRVGRIETSNRPGACFELYLP